MQDILQSIKAYLYDRATSPLMGGFIISWSIWNYRFFLVLLAGGDFTPEQKFQAIERLFPTVIVPIGSFSLPICGELIHGLIIPALITAAYLYGYPLLAAPVYEHSLRRQQKLRAIKQKEEGQRLLSVEESRELYRRLAEMEEKYETETDKYRKQVSALNKTIQELERQESHGAEDAGSQVWNPKFDDINEADPEEFDSKLREGIDALEGGEFELADLFSDEQWKHMYPALKQSIGKRLKEMVLRGDFVGVSVSKKGSRNQQVYAKKSQE
ncbi:MAG: DUF1413 domain-containing protein [Oceanococcus sp.]|nr:MAG: DUF1413 domain-containing protein [Oceanococcus sp.]